MADVEAGGGGGQPATAPKGPAPKNKRLEMTQAQVDEVVGIMKTNVEKVLERDQKLSQLDHRADELQEGASMFEKSAATMKNKYWLKNMKMTIILIVIIVLVVGLLIYYFSK